MIPWSFNARSINSRARARHARYREITGAYGLAIRHGNVRDHVFLGASFLHRAPSEPWKAVRGNYVKNVMWGSDYPHTDGIWPESTKYIEEQFKGLSADDIHKITCENAAKFYNLTN